MRLARTLAFPVLALAAGYAAAVAVLPAASLSADGAADPWAEIKALEKAAEKKDGAADADKCVAKMQAYRDSGGPAAIQNLKSMKDSKAEKVAIKAIRLVAASGDPEFHKWLSGKIEDKDLADEKDGRPNVYMAILDALAGYGEKNKSAQEKLAKMIMKFTDTKPDYATRLVKAYGTVPDKFTVEYLIALCEKLDSRGGGQGGGGGGKSASGETLENRGKVRNTGIETLNALTQQDIADAETYRKWWTEKGKTFVFPKARDPNAPDPAEKDIGDVSGLKEFNDEGYGYLAKRPDAPGWIFEKADYKGPRIAMTYASPDDPNYRIARAYFSVHNPKKYPPKDIKGFVNWAKAEVYAKQMEMGDREVTEREDNFGGALWTVVTGKGDGKAEKQGWGTMERRFYFAPIGSNILYIDAFVRLGAEDDVQKMFWKAVEDTLITAKK